MTGMKQAIAKIRFNAVAIYEKLRFPRGGKVLGESIGCAKAKAQNNNVIPIGISAPLGIFTVPNHLIRYKLNVPITSIDLTIDRVL